MVLLNYPVEQDTSHLNLALLYFDSNFAKFTLSTKYLIDNKATLVQLLARRRTVQAIIWTSDGLFYQLINVSFGLNEWMGGFTHISKKVKSNIIMVSD